MCNLRNIGFLTILFVGTTLGCTSTRLPPVHPSEQILDPITIRPEGNQPKQLKREGLRIPDGLTGRTASVASDLEVTESGNVARTVLVSGDPVLHEALAKAATEWRFEPFIVEGKPRAFVLPLRVDLSWADGAARIKMRIRDAE